MRCCASLLAAVLSLTALCLYFILLLLCTSFGDVSCIFFLVKKPCTTVQQLLYQRGSIYVPGICLGRNAATHHYAKNYSRVPRPGDPLGRGCVATLIPLCSPHLQVF